MGSSVPQKLVANTGSTGSLHHLPEVGGIISRFYRALRSQIISQRLKDTRGPCLEQAAFIFACVKYCVCDLKLFPQIGGILLIFRQLRPERAISSIIHLVGYHENVSSLIL